MRVFSLEQEYRAGTVFKASYVAISPPCSGEVESCENLTITLFPFE